MGVPRSGEEVTSKKRKKDAKDTNANDNSRAKKRKLSKSKDTFVGEGTGGEEEDVAARAFNSLELDWARYELPHQFSMRHAAMQYLHLLGITP